MKTLSIRQYRPRGIARLLGGPGAKYFKKADIERLIELIPDENRELTGFITLKVDDGDGGLRHKRVTRQWALSHRLENAAATYQYLCEQQQRPTALVRAEHFESIAAAATELLNALGTPDGDVQAMPSLLRYDGGLESIAALPNLASRRPGFPGQIARAEALRSAVSGVERLRHWASIAKQRTLGTDLEGARPKHAADEARKVFLRCLCAIWIEVIGRNDIERRTFRAFAEATARILGIRFARDRAISELVLSVRKSPEFKKLIPGFR